MLYFLLNNRIINDSLKYQNFIPKFILTNVLQIVVIFILFLVGKVCTIRFSNNPDVVLNIYLTVLGILYVFLALKENISAIFTRLLYRDLDYKGIFSITLYNKLYNFKDYKYLFKILLEKRIVFFHFYYGDRLGVRLILLNKDNVKEELSVSLIVGKHLSVIVLSYLISRGYLHKNLERTIVYDIVDPSEWTAVHIDYSFIDNEDLREMGLGVKNKIFSLESIYNNS